MSFWNRSKTVFVAGHRGLVGRALVRRLKAVTPAEVITATRHELDLRDPAAVETWFQTYRPNIVIHAAGRVGGIVANASLPVDFLHDNALMALNVLRSAANSDCEKLLYLGSSCIYPRDCAQPITEDQLLTGPLELTNRPYALAKIAGVLACDAYRQQLGCDFISAMPTNLYGPYDNFHPEHSHVIPGLIQRFHAARQQGLDEVVVWGSGRPRREFLHVDDLASACLFLIENYSQAGPMNIGCGQDYPIARVAEIIRDLVHPRASIRFDTSKPDGTPQKLLDVTRLADLGWQASLQLEDGLKSTWQWYLENSEQARVGHST